MPNVSEKVRSRIWSLETQIGKGILDGTHDPEVFADILQDFLEHKGEATLKPVSLFRVISILGLDKVITEDQVALHWGPGLNRLTDPKDVLIRYSEKTLRQCTNENIDRKSDWRLIYCRGFSLRQLHGKRGIDWRKNQPCFHKDNNDWLKSEEDILVNQTFPAGYYLLNFNGQFGEISWGDQELELTKLGKEFKRCPEAIFTEAVFTIYMVNNGERIAKDWWHWGTAKRSNGRHVFVGDFREGGFYISDSRDYEASLYKKVVVLRDFDC
jgi:hypothetical protein